MLQNLSYTTVGYVKKCHQSGCQEMLWKFCPILLHEMPRKFWDFRNVQKCGISVTFTEISQCLKCSFSSCESVMPIILHNGCFCYIQSISFKCWHILNSTSFKHKQMVRLLFPTIPTQWLYSEVSDKLNLAILYIDEIVH